MSEYAIELNSVTKLYANGKGVKDISFEIPRGEIFGFLGPNGAGKSTTIRTMMNFIHPDAGSIQILGMSYQQEREQILSKIGYLTSDISLYRELTAKQLFSLVSGIRGSYDQTYLKQLVGSLDAQIDQKIETLSKGNKQKISLILATMYKPEILIMDEPTSGLDPFIKEIFYNIIREASEQGTTVFISSHDLAEVQKICKKAAFIRSGRIIDIEDLANKDSLRLNRFEISFQGEVMAKKISQIESVSDVLEKGDHFIITLQGDINPLIAFMHSNPVRYFSAVETSLEDVFMHYYSDTSKR